MGGPRELRFVLPKVHLLETQPALAEELSCLNQAPRRWAKVGSPLLLRPPSVALTRTEILGAPEEFATWEPTNNRPS